MSNRRPLVIGLTGSIGMGKTETAKMFARLGVPVFDADAAVHQIYEYDPDAISAVDGAFPDCVSGGRVDRSCLAARVRDDAAALARLESIVHPFVARRENAFLAEAVRCGADLVVLDIPLLFETGAESRTDAVVIVSAPDSVQRERVLARAGMSDELLERILARQMPDVDKRARAHFVVETDKGLDHAFAQVESIVTALRAQRGKGGDA